LNEQTQDQSGATEAVVRSTTREEVVVGRVAPSPRAKHLRSLEPRCSASTAKDEPCPGRRMAGVEFCFQHNPDPLVAEKRTAARRLGGLRATQKAPPPDLPLANFRDRDHIRALLEKTTDAILAGRIAASQAHAVSSLCATAMKELELEARLLEAKAKEQHRKKPPVFTTPDWMKRPVPTSENVDPGATAASTDGVNDDVETRRCEGCGIALVETKGTEVICGGCKTRQRTPLDIA